MEKDLQQQAIRMKQYRKHRKHWQMLVRTLALCVVFCTTYVLVLPAITMQQDPICGLADHVHSNQCWSHPGAALQNCGIPFYFFLLNLHSTSLKLGAEVARPYFL